MYNYLDRNDEGSINKGTVQDGKSEVRKCNVEDLLRNSSVVDLPSTSKHVLNGANSFSPQEGKKVSTRILPVYNTEILSYFFQLRPVVQIKTGENNEEFAEKDITQEDMLNSVTKTSNTFKDVQFPGYYDKLKAVWYTREAEAGYYVIDLGNRVILNQTHDLLNEDKLKLLFDRLTLDNENDLLSKNTLQYLSLFDQIIEEYPDDEEDDNDVVIKKNIQIENEIILKMEKEIKNLNGLSTKFKYLSHTLPILIKEYDELIYPDIHIIKSISSHLSAISKMDRVTVNTAERSWTVSGDPGNPDPDKYNDNHQKLFKEGIFALNKFIIKMDLPKIEVYNSLGVFLAQGYKSKEKSNNSEQEDSTRGRGCGRGRGRGRSCDSI
ncbi:hypothetical protein Glove_216g97 [Diversispora epigaea]|uniref:Uncharacterized protein n=1 Tax=Diversispora epigaea TaxID=1348612 RepID=A0A397IQC9_9GLOM|nr:hypothetical protein Glove_216g97 [Diversispora epigaea]